MKIQQTENYSLLKRITGNRTINKAQVSKLVDSLGRNPELASAIPIIVNDKMEIIDGQHRFEALKKLGLPVTYMISEGLGLRAVQILNSATKVWIPIDYAKSYSEVGLVDYDIYLEFKKKYHLSHNILLSYLSQTPESDNMRGKGNTLYTFREGRFKVGDIDIARKLCETLIDALRFYNRGDTKVFAKAWKVCVLNPKYDHQRMMGKIAENPTLFRDSPYAEDYMRQLEKIYNFHMGTNRVKLF